MDRLLLFLIVHSSKDKDHAKAMKNLDAAFKGETIYSISTATFLARVYCIWKYLDTLEADFELARTPTAACLTVRFRVLPLSTWSSCVIAFRSSCGVMAIGNIKPKDGQMPQNGTLPVHIKYSGA